MWQSPVLPPATTKNQNSLKSQFENGDDSRIGFIWTDSHKLVLFPESVCRENTNKQAPLAPVSRGVKVLQAPRIKLNFTPSGPRAQYPALSYRVELFTKILLCSWSNQQHCFRDSILISNLSMRKLRPREVKTAFPESQLRVTEWRFKPKFPVLFWHHFATLDILVDRGCPGTKERLICRLCLAPNHLLSIQRPIVLTVLEAKGSTS